jgi:DNA topoisomerase VI subunit B
MENIKKIDLIYTETDSKDNEFENFLWKRAKSVSSEKIKENNNFLTDLKRKLTPNEVVQTISEDIEEYMVDYLKTMEFAKSHSNEI